MAVTAIKKGITRNFTDFQWKNMPRDKYGWTVIESFQPAGKSIPIPEEIIQKKMVAGARNIKPEIEVPEELLSVPKKIVPKATKK